MDAAVPTLENWHEMESSSHDTFREVGEALKIQHRCDGDHWLEFIKVFPGFDGICTDPHYAELLKNLRLE